MSTHSIGSLVSTLEQADLRDPVQRGLLIENLELFRTGCPEEQEGLTSCVEAATLLARSAGRADEDAVVAELQRLVHRILVLVEYLAKNLTQAAATPIPASNASAAAPAEPRELNGMLLSEILVQFGLLDSDDARRVANACEDESLLGEQLLELGLVSEDDLEAARHFQARLRGEELPQDAHPVAEPARADSSSTKIKARLGEILVQRGVVSAADLERAIQAQKSDGRPLGETLISMRLASPRDVARALRGQAGPG